MSCLHYRETELYIENSRLKQVAEKFGTPCYVYSSSALASNWQAFDEALKSIPHRICYAVKANSNLAILHQLAKLNSGFDIVSLGELERVIAAGGDPKKVIFSGIGKSEIEIEQAIKKKIHCFNVESEAELEKLHQIASRLNTTVNVALRVNPNIDPHTHNYISTGLKENKFGIEINKIIPLGRQLASASHLRLIGIASHIGSQIVKLNPFLSAANRLLDIYLELRKSGINVQHINVGGGLGITYHDEHPPAIAEYVKALQQKFLKHPVEIIIEPGRSIVGNAGALLTRIEYLKHTSQKNFVIVDTGMNDLLRPALYNAWQAILPVELRNSEKRTYDIAGPVCESADFLGKNRTLAVQPGDYLAIDSAGAYGFSMSSNYNSRCRPAEVLIENDKMRLIRRRETIEDLFALEKI
ncbi:diaminopimelate decarboxylase [Aquicella lusitana]|jgi:diaminopimelate decarboxylase|uniref:Diaminopimelate decarboxylase n=1 Tax=Aquicella lusitana TaxID=254246 RepID=A0A370GKM3_9COXI|nr:diaminopimelate decarboxylase [Aquicella lusitana]RDI43776.1 diaminopimelate decarboxylase [Aquicella lusitana]VVC74493.1 Diaminopimelate decarboxylase [Aquicella lusitana]